MKIISLETKHYLLRGLSIGDAPALFDILKDRKTMQYITPHPVQTLEEMEEKMKAQLANFQQQKEIPWAIIHKESKQLIGMFRLHKLHLWHKKAEMGVVIAEDFQNKGVMTELLPEILRFGFLELGLNRIVGDIFAENTGSRKLLKKFGFHKDGVLRQTDFDGETYHDTVVYSMLKSEYDRGFKDC